MGFSPLARIAASLNLKKIRTFIGSVHCNDSEVNMSDKRLHPRFPCHMKVRFRYFEGDPDTIDLETAPSKKGKGVVLDISLGGILIASNNRVNISAPIMIEFRTKKEKLALSGTIVRTGLMENNPSDIAQQYKGAGISGDTFIAVHFNTELDHLDENDVLSV
jgi:hypothetical protein